MADIDYSKMDQKELKEICKALNSLEWETEEGKQSPKIKLVGITKMDQLTAFAEAVELIDSDKLAPLPDQAVAFYNKWISGENAPLVEEEPAKEEPAKKEPAKKEPAKTKATGGPIGKKVDSWEELVKILENPPNPTRHFDALCLKGGKIEDLVKEQSDFMAEKHPQMTAMRTKNYLLGHIKYRETTGYVYERGEEGYIKLVGLEK